MQIDYSGVADMLWYAGHILSGISVLYSSSHYEEAVVLVLIGQGITIASRPIGRVKPQLVTIDPDDLVADMV